MPSWAFAITLDLVASYVRRASATGRGSKRVLKPGGRFAAVVQGLKDRNNWQSCILDIFRKYVPIPTPDPDAPHPFKFARQGSRSRALEAAGLQEVQENFLEIPICGPTLEGVSTMEAAEKYARCIDAVHAQRLRIRGEATGDSWDRDAARRFRYDPRRELDANVEAIAAYVQPQDAVLDVGGGAGRVCLPLAFRSRQVINIDPAPAMRAEFEESAAEAGIENVRFIQADWLDAEPIQGDVVITANVTYFVRDISSFIKKLDKAARRRVVMNVWSVPPPNQNARLFRLVYGEEMEEVPGHRQLLPVLWELGILADVYVQPGQSRTSTFRQGELPKIREEAVQEALRGRWLGVEHQGRGRKVIEEHFEELYEPGPEGYRPKWRPESREMLITWETQR